MKYNPGKALSLTLLLYLISSQTCIYAQEQLGLKLGNYTGIHANLINPAWAITGNFNWDINLIAAGAFVQNNFGFLENTSVTRVLGYDGEFLSRPDIDPEDPIDPNAIVADFNRSRKNKMGVASTFVTGPSVMFRIGNHNVGLITNFRAMGGSNKIPESLSYYELEGQQLNTPFTVGKFQAGVMAWSEVGINYSTKLLETADGELFVGGTLKFLQGYEGIYFRNRQKTDITLLPSDSASLPSVDAIYGFSTNLNFDPVTGDTDYSFQQNGSGFGLDMGAGFTIPGYEEGNYKLKIGASLLDIGSISFRKNAEKHHLQLDSSFITDLDAFENVNTKEEAIALISNQVFGDSASSLVGNRISMATPAAISVQADFSVHKYFYIGAAVVQRLPMGNGPQRTNIISLAPRFELRWFELSIPMVLLNERFFRIGAAMRLGPLSIGSDNVSGLFNKKSELAGTDFYVALKINSFFSIQRSKKEKEGGGRFGRSGKVKCYNF